MRLLSPKFTLGLGRISNYVQDLFVGVSSWNNHFTSFAGLIPNSEIVIIPILKYDVSGKHLSTEFKIEMYMNPSTTTFGIILVLCTIMAILVGVIYILDVIERREDETERRKRLHELNFDAL